MIAVIFSYFNLFVVGITALFAVFLLTKSAQSRSARALLYVFIAIMAWLAFEFLGSSFQLSDNYSLFFWRITFSAVFLMVYLNFRFVLILTDKIIARSLNLALFSLTLIFALVAPLGDYIIKAIAPFHGNWGKEYILGSLFIPGAILIVLVMSLSVVLLIVKLLQLKKKEDEGYRKTIVFILLGILVPMVVGVTTNLIFPILKIDFPKLVSPAVLAMVIFFTYAIYQWQALGIPVRRLKIGTRIAVFFLGATFLAVVLGGVFLYFRISDVFKNEIVNKNENLLEAKSRYIDFFLDENENLAREMASLYAVIDYLTVNPTQADFSVFRNKAENRVNEFKEINKQIYKISLINIDGEIMYSTDENELDFSGEEEEEIMIAVRQGKPFFEDVHKLAEDDEPCIDYVYPVLKNEKVIGAVVLDVNLSFIYDSLTRDSLSGLSQETYLITSNGLVASPLKKFNNFKEFSRVKVSDDLAKACRVEKNNYTDDVKITSFSYSNFVGERMAGVISRIPQTGWCLISEVEEGAIQGYVFDRIFLNLLFMTLIILFFVFIAGRYLARSISLPIIRLQEDAALIEQGDFDHKVSVESKDEIGDLSRAFNKMVDAIKKSRAEITVRVEEQTKDIKEKQTLLEEQQKAVLNILEDVEKEKELTLQERDKIDTIVHSIGDGVFVVNENYKIILFNQVAAEIAGFTVKEAIGKRYDEVLVFNDEKTGEKADSFIHEVIKTGEPKEMSNHTILVNKNGEKVAVSDSASPVKDRDGKVIGCVVVFRDVTKEREVDKAKTEFVSLSSHQLRTPLTSINWYTEMLLSGDAGKLNDEQKNYLTEIYEGTHRMVDLVNSLLNVSRIELGTFAIDPEPVDLVKMGESLINELRPDAEAKKMEVSFVHEPNLPIYNADTKLARMIFQNLMSNAIKYTPANGKVKLEIKLKDQDILIAVTDNGLGIPRNAKDKIFTKLYRADNVRSSDTTGTGLGLYIIKSIVDKVGGKIWFDSTENKGTTFYVALPLSGWKKTEGSKPLT